MLTNTLLAALAAAAYLQAPEEKTRALWDTIYLNKRPAPKKASPGQQKAASASADDGFVGLTLWRLRPSRSENEQGTRLFVHGNSWTPMRAAADSLLSRDPNYHYRFSVETARAGYLYIVDREQFADNSFGPPVLIFPTRKLRNGDNRVTPGVLVEIPAQRDDPPYMRLDSDNKQIAEVITILVTTKPLTDIRIGPDPVELDPSTLAEWERHWGAQVTRLEASTVGKPWTPAEKAAGSGASTLTSKDPTPQTLYKVASKAGEPLLVNVQLRIEK